MTKNDRLSSSFSKLSVSSNNQIKHPQNEFNDLDLDTVVQNDTGRKLFTMYLKEFNNSCDKLVTLYLICCCMQNQKRIDDRQRIKQILEKTYNVCCIRNELTHLSPDLKAKLGESLQRKTYNESIFNAVKSELKTLLEATYFPQFKESKYFADNAQFLNSLLDKQASNSSQLTGRKDRMSEKHSTSLVSLDSEKRPLKKTDNASPSFFAMPNVPKNKPLASNSSSRVLKQSKSSSSSTSSMASVSSTSKPVSGAKTLRNITSSNKANANTSKTSLSNLESSRLKTHYKSNTSINSLPPNPYHVPSKAIPVSAQDSERQSVMSADDVNINKKASAHHLPKMNRQIKENLIANKNAKLNMPEFNNEQATQPMKKPTQTSQVPLSESNPAEFFNIIASKLEDYLQQSSIPYESDIDAQLDDHLSRVYNTNDNPNTSKMSFVKVSSLSRSTRHDRSLNHSNISYSIPHHHNQHQSNVTDTNNLSSTALNPSNKHQHHFYKLTSTSKEVDIDDTTHHSKVNTNIVKHHKGSSHSHTNRHNPLDNYDSGVSIRSAASNERVNEWLNQSSQAEEVPEEIKKPKRISPATPDKKCLQMNMNKKSDFKTTVAYYLPGEDLAYISTFNGENLNLAQFKQLIAKKGQFRYFFKTKSDLLDEECVVYQEATDEYSTVPMFNSKVIAKIETC